MSEQSPVLLNQTPYQINIKKHTCIYCSSSVFFKCPTDQGLLEGRERGRVRSKSPGLLRLQRDEAVSSYTIKECNTTHQENCREPWRKGHTYPAHGRAELHLDGSYTYVYLTARENATSMGGCHPTKGRRLCNLYHTHAIRCTLVSPCKGTSNTISL